MIARVALVGALALAAGPTPLSTAADTSCHGRPVTIVGTPGQPLRGTDRADVIVTNGAADVAAGAGADLVCVTPGTGQPPRRGVFVAAGAGDDVVDARAAGQVTTGAQLGAGTDVYLGGPGTDNVGAGRLLADGDPPGPDRDRIDTGDGPDHVYTGGRSDWPDPDVVDLGPGADSLVVFGSTSPDGRFVGGRGNDTLDFQRAVRTGHWRLDNSTGVAAVDDVTVMRWDGLEAFTVWRLRARSSLDFVGSGAPERLTSFGASTTADMGGGDDLVAVDVGFRVRTEGIRVDGGAGRDRLRLDGDRLVVLDLASGFLGFYETKQGNTPSSAVGMEHADVVAFRTVLRGTPDDNRLRYAACDGRVVARSGDDSIMYRGRLFAGCQDGVTDLVVRGGPGDDALVGGRLDDHLVGGPGEDTADGRRGHDACDTERTRRCEA